MNWGIVNVLEIVKKYSPLPLQLQMMQTLRNRRDDFRCCKGMKDFIVITLGTGLGSGIVVNSELVYGSDGFAGEIGHTIVDPNGQRVRLRKKRMSAKHMHQLWHSALSSS